jgi:hypothetical protein
MWMELLKRDRVNGKQKVYKKVYQEINRDNSEGIN